MTMSQENYDGNFGFIRLILRGTRRSNRMIADEDDVLGVGIARPPRNTSKAMLPDSCAIRKSAHGRAQMYLEDACYSDMRCSSSITQHQHRHSMFHRHSQNGRLPEVFQQPSTTACFHCCEYFDTPPIPLPKEYDASINCFVVYGNFCSLACCKAFLCESSSSFNSGLQILLLEKMAREVYNEFNVGCAPPRLTLERFGGPFSIARFRAMHSKKRVIEHTPPFVCAYHVIEERDEQHDTPTLDIQVPGSVRGLRRPARTVEATTTSQAAKALASPYDTFLQNKSSEALTKDTGLLKNQNEEVHLPNNGEPSGTLACFMR